MGAVVTNNLFRNHFKGDVAMMSVYLSPYRRMAVLREAMNRMF